jgi:hypothetical protein
MLEAFACFSLEINARGDELWLFKKLPARVKRYTPKMGAVEREQRIARYTELAAQGLPLTPDE